MRNRSLCFNRQKTRVNNKGIYLLAQNQRSQGGNFRARLHPAVRAVLPRTSFLSTPISSFCGVSLCSGCIHQRLTARVFPFGGSKMTHSVLHSIPSHSSCDTQPGSLILFVMRKAQQVSLHIRFKNIPFLLLSTS